LGTAPGGYNGKLLRVDLSRNRYVEENLNPTEARKYLGGRCWGARLLLEELRAGVDPLGPENKLIFLTGPLNGFSHPGCAKYYLMAKSPATHAIGEAMSGGFFGPFLKFAGFDILIVEGVSEVPVYINILNGHVDIRSAQSIWGKSTRHTEEFVKRDLDDKNVKIASIGIAGENLVKFASVMNDLYHAAARTGLGAVMGSKRLKAVAVGGNPAVPLASEDEFKRVQKEAVSSVVSDARVVERCKYGTTTLVAASQAIGTLPTKNFMFGTFTGAEAISGEALSKRCLVYAKPCYGCPITCDRMIKMSDGPYAGLEGVGPEYETLASFGSLCLNDQLDVICKANELCNEAGLDTISTGIVIAFLMECKEKGLLGRIYDGEQTFSWGDGRTILDAITKIAERSKIGNLLAEGLDSVREKIGGNSGEFALTIKGLEMPLHDPRGKTGLGLSYAISSRGACHLRIAHDPIFENRAMPEIGVNTKASRFSFEHKPEMVVKLEDWEALLGSLVFCRFTAEPLGPINLNRLEKALRAVTGWQVEDEEMLRVGERAVNLERLFNLREGFTFHDDRLPHRFSEALESGASGGHAITKDDLDKMLNEYYRLRGWRDGVPSTEKLDDLGIAEFANFK